MHELEPALRRNGPRITCSVGSAGIGVQSNGSQVWSPQSKQPEQSHAISVLVSRSLEGNVPCRRKNKQGNEHKHQSSEAQNCAILPVETPGLAVRSRACKAVRGKWIFPPRKATFRFFACLPVACNALLLGRGPQLFDVNAKHWQRACMPAS